MKNENNVFIHEVTWDEFEAEVSELQSNTIASRAATASTVTDWIFRGQSNFNWGLETSLERFLSSNQIPGATDYLAKKYYRKLSAIVPAINSLTEFKFETFIPDDVKLKWWGHLPKLELICFARHHGFPTPLLDWSMSHYVAAYFAYASSDGDTDVAIYAFQEFSGEARAGWASDPIWHEIGPYIETHPRHYRQQSCYTFCTAKNSNEDVVFKNHIDAVKVNPESHRVKKFILPGKQKSQVLQKLHKMNINAHTLFDNHEGLMEDLAFREFIFK